MGICLNDYEIAVWTVSFRDPLRVKKRPIILPQENTLFPKSKTDFFEKVENIIREVGYFARIDKDRYGIKTFLLILEEQKRVARFHADYMALIEVEESKIKSIQWNDADPVMREIKREYLYADKFPERPRLFSGRLP